ncbi:MAG: Uma2 family endonuclease [Spirulina sp.]
MIQTLPKLLSFEEFLDWYPKNGSYELHEGVVVELKPTGTHPKISGFLTIEFGIEVQRLKLPFFIPTKLKDYEEMEIPEYWIVDDLGLAATRYIGSPKLPVISVYSLVNGEYQVTRFRGDEKIVSLTFPELQLTANQIFNAAK